MLNMCGSALILTCLAWLSQGRRVQTPFENLQGSAITKSQDILDSMRKFAMLLAVSDSAATFNPAGPGLPVSGQKSNVAALKRNHATPFSLLDMQHRMGHDAPVMSMNEEEWANMMRETRGEDHLMKKETLDFARLKFGPEDPRTLDALSEYAVALSKLGRQSEAEPLMSEALELKREVLGHEHPDTLKTLNLYADILLKIGMQAEAKPVGKDVLEGEMEAQELANAITNDAAPGGGSKFCLNVKLCIKPERRDEFIECIKNNQKGTLETEPLAIEYVWGEDTESPNTFHFYEKYAGKAGFEAHQATPHFAAWETFADSDPFTEPPRVEFYQEC
mmetsp:Transcript_160437/g.307985  ORF Transcript_160437/g.307985 Transcript_160437/m.307985 type:complete len:334 (-) Transcript_160437:57-1058(-)